MAKEKSEIAKYQSLYASQYKHILSKIEEYDNIVIFRHIMPDYDCLGTQLGLYTWIKDNYPSKNVKVVGDNHVTFTPRLFPPMDVLHDADFEKPFLALIVDASNASRVADPRWDKAAYTIKIDHHPDVENFTDYKLVDPQMVACAELMCNMLFDVKKTVMSETAATYFFIGIIGDSGRLQYPSTTVHTFEIVEKLMRCGINIDKIYQNMYVKKIEDLNVTAYILNNFSVSDHGVAYYVLDLETQDRLHITTERGKENVNLFSNIDGINAWCSITEDGKDHCWRVSIRSKEKAINGVAAMFEGGGHDHASGAKLWSLDDLPRLIEELDKLFIE